MNTGSKTTHIGTSLNQYQITARVGAGGMGEVFRARDSRLNRDVAVKVLPKDFVADADRLRRFEQEAKTLAALNHPNVLTIHDAGVHEGAPYLVSELLEGRTLREEMNGGALPVRKATDYALQIAHGLAAAHSKGVVHRDLKPENIFVTKDGRVKILDFGLAKLRNPSPGLRPPSPLGGERDGVRGESGVPTIRMDGDTIVNSTEPGAVLGTPGYMSPEQVRGETADHRSDIFAFGTTLHEMFSGVHPFRRGTVVETMTAILKEEPPELTKSNPNLPPAVDRIVQRCLEKQPDNRFQSAKDLAFAFAQISSTRSTASERGSANAEWNRLCMLALVLLLVIGLAGIAGWWFFQQRTRFSSARIMASRITSLAVKPLDDISGDTNQAYLSDGMTEALCASLGNISALRVPGRASVMRYKGGQKTIREIARELNVDAIVEGSVQRAANHVLITIQLIEAVTDRHLWSTNYQRDLSDFFKVQTEVAQAIAKEIQVRLTPQEESRLAQAQSTKAEAVEAYLKARFHLARGSKEGFEQALRSFKEAVRLDDKFAKAYSGIADAYMLAMGWFVEDAVALSLGLTAATNAVALDATSAEAHTSLGSFYTAMWRWADAEASFKTALRLNPRYALGYLEYGNLRLLTGKGEEEGLNLLVRGHELEPGDPMFASWLGWACVHIGRYDAATNYLNKALELDRNSWHAQERLGLSFAFQGNYAEAIVWTEKAVKVSERNVEILGDLGWIYGKAGDSAKAQAVLNELLTTKQPRTASPWMVALVYLGLSQSEDAIKQVQDGLRVRDPALMFLRLDRRFDPLRQDARFKEIMKTIGFTK